MQHLEEVVHFLFGTAARRDLWGIMLWCLGAKIGCDEELLHNLDLLGFRAVIMAGGIIAGSLSLLWIVTRLFAADIKREDQGDKV